MLGFAGVTAMDEMVFVAAVTVSVAVALTLFAVALMVVVPAATAVASPAVLMVATVVFDELHVTPLVSVPVVPSLYVAVAVNCCVPPMVTLGAVGESEIAVTVTAAALIVKVVDALTLFNVAEMLEVPAETPVAMPPEVMVATAVLDELQVTELVIFDVLPSLKFPVAVNCWVALTAMPGVEGVIVIELSVLFPPVMVCGEPQPVIAIARTGIAKPKIWKSLRIEAKVFIEWSP
jgi:hypothetical protein